MPRRPRQLPVYVALLLAASPAAADPIVDLCAPCGDGAQCLSGICALDPAAASGFCTQACSLPANPCPTGFQCSSTQQNQNLCAPQAASACPAAGAYLAPLNVTCQRPSTAANPNGGIANRTCAAGLVCFGFASGVATCLDRCSAVNPAYVCGSGEQCCFDVDDLGHCVGPQPATPNGGCFLIRHVGDGCVDAYQALCDTQTQCFFVGHPTLAKCHHMCPLVNGTQLPCAQGEICVNDVFPDASNNFQAVCCDRSKWDPNNPGTCVPVAGACLREVGVACDDNDQCASGYCLKNRGKAACSRACSADSDCVAAAVDVNGDGQPDGGSRCIDLNGSGACWVITAPATPPACAVVAAAPAAAKGGGCRGGPGGGASAGLALALAALGRAWRRRGGVARGARPCGGG